MEEFIMNRRGTSVFWGGIFLLAGAFIIFSQLGYLGHVNLATILISVGLGAIMIHSIPSVNFAGILIPAAFLCILYDAQWGITALTPWPVLITAVLGSIGLSMIFKKRYHYFHHHKKKCHKHANYFSDDEAEVIDSPEDGKVSFSNRFGSSIKYINSDDFRRAELDCDFGAMKVYFDNAVIQGESAELYINASFSGVEISIPKNWRIENFTQCTLGGFDDHMRRRSDEYEKVLKVYGNISFSGVEIFYI